MLNVSNSVIRVKPTGYKLNDYKGYTPVIYCPICGVELWVDGGYYLRCHRCGAEYNALLEKKYIFYEKSIIKHALRRIHKILKKSKMFKEFLSECYSDTDYDVTVKTEIRTYLDGYAFYVIIDYDSREEDPDCCSYYTEYYFCGDEQLKKRYDYTLNDIEDDVWCSIYGLLEELKKRTVVYSPNLKAKSLEAFRCLDGYMITEKEEVDFFLQSKYLERAKCPREFSGDLVTTKKYYEIQMNTIPATEYKEFPGSGEMKLYIRKELAKYADSIIYKRLYEKLAAQ